MTLWLQQLHWTSVCWRESVVEAADILHSAHDCSICTSPSTCHHRLAVSSLPKVPTEHITQKHTTNHNSILAHYSEQDIAQLNDMPLRPTAVWQPPSKCFWSVATDGFIAALATWGWHFGIVVTSYQQTYSMLVCTGMGDHLRMCISSWYVTSQLGQLSVSALHPSEHSRVAKSSTNLDWQR